MNPYLAEASMYITKATNDGKVMRWAATNSDTDPDLYEERMSMELYKSFIENIANDIPVPEVFRGEVCSEYWDGGMPYVSVSHYSDLNGEGVPGEPIQLYVEGNRLKAKGILFDSPLGHAVYRSLKEDKIKNPENKIRISIGFLDLAHKHGEDGELFVREGLFSTCPQCEKGVGEKIYVKGYLVHLALTRVPVNQRTEMVLEEKSMATKTVKAKKTRKEDAASIVGKDLAEEIDVKQKVTRSDLLVEMSETDEAVETPESTETPETENELSVSVNDAEAQTETEPASQEEVVLESEQEVEKSYTLPYGGAVSMKEAQAAREAAQEMVHVMDMFSMFQNVAWNIIDREDVTDKKAAFSKAVDEFKSMLAAKAMVEFSNVSPNGERDESDENSAHELQPAIDALLENIDNSAQLSVDVPEKLQAINPALQQFGTAITDYVSKSVSNEPAPAPNENVTEILKNLIQPLADGISTLTERLGVLESKSTAQTVEAKQRIPAPRTHSLPPTLLAKSESTVKPGSIRDIVNRSVGIKE